MFVSDVTKDSVTLEISRVCMSFGKIFSGSRAWVLEILSGKGSGIGSGHVFTRFLGTIWVLRSVAARVPARPLG